MTDLNSVTVIGRLTKDVDLRVMQNGTAVGNMSVAVNHAVKKGEQWEDEASFFEVTLWGKQAEALKPYLMKGQQVAVQGYLKQSTWEKDGEKRSKVVIIADNLQLVGGKRDGSTGSGTYNNAGNNAGYNNNASNAGNSGYQAPEPPPQQQMGFSEDIPF